MPNTYILISHLQIHNANAMSSTYTIGFPAMTAWLGAVHAAQRKLNVQSEFENVRFIKTAVACYSCDLQTFKGRGDYRYSIIGTANPLRKKGTEFVRPPFIEEARTKLEVSLLIEATGVNPDNEVQITDSLQSLVPQMKFASGDVMSLNNIEVVYVDSHNPTEAKKLLYKIMPGYVLVERRDLLNTDDTEDSDCLDVLMDYLQVNYVAKKNEEGVITGWNSQRKSPGWLVPIGVGFKRISTFTSVSQQRDPGIDHCFVESIVTLGEFKMSHRFSSIDEIMWQYAYNEKQQLYVCKNKA